MIRGSRFFAYTAFALTCWFPFAAQATPETSSPQPTVTAAPATPTPSPVKQLEHENKKLQSLESFARALNILESIYVDEKAVDSDVLIEKAIKGMVSSLDPHTVYLPAADLREFASDTSGKFAGVGVVISHNHGRMEIVDVIPGSPAAKAGIKPGDTIYAIDNNVVTSQNQDDLLSKIRGLPGTTIRIEIIPAEEQKSKDNRVAEAKGNVAKIAAKPKTKSFKLEREIIRTPSVTDATLSDGYAYVKLSLFQEDTAESLDRILHTYEDRWGGKLNGLILDLRNNPGGLLDQAVKVADLFIDSGIIVSTIGRDRSRQEAEFATKRTTHPYMPLVVLVNEKSASASEIVAGALQDHDRAVIIGTTTFGKGSVQSVIPLPNGAGLKLTVARYYTPKGRSIQAKGITPDIPLNSTDKSALDKPERESRKEADLEGHIEASDLAQKVQAQGFAEDVEKWPPQIRNDNQVKIAYSYIRSWARFKKE